MGDPQRLRIPVFYDLASLICFVGHRVMGRMRAELDALELELVWTPIDLASITHWRRGAAIRGPGRDNALRVAAELGVEARMPACWMDSRRANAVALALAGSDREPSWRERVFTAVFEEGRSLDEPGLLDALGRDLGIPARAYCGDPELDRLEIVTDGARVRGVTGVPTFLLDEWPFGGIQHPDTMRSLLARWAAKRRG